MAYVGLGDIPENADNADVRVLLSRTSPASRGKGKQVYSRARQIEANEG